MSTIITIFPKFLIKKCQSFVLIQDINVYVQYIFIIFVYVILTYIKNLNDQKLFKRVSF